MRVAGMVASASAHWLITFRSTEAGSGARTSYLVPSPEVVERLAVHRLRLRRPTAAREAAAVVAPELFEVASELSLVGLHGPSEVTISCFTSAMLNRVALDER